MTMLQWRPRVVYLRDDQNSLHLWDIHGSHFRVKRILPEHMLICDLLREPRTADSLLDLIVRCYPDFCEQRLHQFLALLKERNLLDIRSSESPARLPTDELERYDRQLAYFGFFETPDRNRYRMQRSLAEASVTIIGLGGVGNWVSWHLAMMGVGRLTLVDHDVIELSNLNRQGLYLPSELGMTKVEVASRRLSVVNPKASICSIQQMVTGPEDVKQVAHESDVLVLTADQPVVQIRRWVSEACVSESCPWVQGSLDAYLLQVGPFYHPPDTGCFSCREIAIRARDPVSYDARIAAAMHSPRPRPPLIGPLCGFVGAAVAMDVVRFLTGIHRPSTWGRYFSIDSRSWTTWVEPFERHEDCPMCSHLKPGGGYPTTEQTLP